MPATEIDPAGSSADKTGFEARIVESVLNALTGYVISVDSGPRTRGKAKAATPNAVKISTGPKGTKREHGVIDHVNLVVFVDDEVSFAKGKGRKAEDFENVLFQAVRGVVLESDVSRTVQDPAVFRIAQIVGRSLPKARREASEATIEKMVGVLVETQDPTAKVRAEIDADNARARVRFMDDFQSLTAEQVTDRAGSKAQNRHQTASRWKKEGRIFGVPWEGLERYPSFQFKEGRPLPVVQEILAALPRGMSAWETAFWFVSTNGWLDGAAPRERLNERERVVEAARLEGQAFIG